MKAVAAALVLIAGAAVVLWYGNTLNSWVLGGLIGGLAALLLSIPISLTLFSFLSRRHDERLKVEAQEELSPAQLYDYPDAPKEAMRTVYEAESYMLPEDEEWDEEEESYYPVHPMRSLPAPSYPRLPAAHQGRPSQRLSATQRGAYLPAPGGTGRPSRSMPLVRRKDSVGRRTTSHRMSYPGFPGYQPGVSRSQHLSAALRAARMEAVQQQQFDDVEELPTYAPRRIPEVRSNQSLIARHNQAVERHSSRQLPQQDTHHNYPRRPRRTVDASPSQNGLQRSLPAGGESTASRSGRSRDLQTDYLNHIYPQTGPMRYPTQTDKITHRPQFDEESLDPDNITGQLQRPLVRRAPYMYEDDPLRQELAQRIEPPSVRRSSRYLTRQNNDEAE